MANTPLKKSSKPADVQECGGFSPANPTQFGAIAVSSFPLRPELGIPARIILTFVNDYRF
jgi:hypothetical protein